MAAEPFVLPHVAGVIAPADTNKAVGCVTVTVIVPVQFALSVAVIVYVPTDRFDCVAPTKLPGDQVYE